MIYLDDLITYDIEKIYEKVLHELKFVVPLKKVQENKLEKFKEILTQIKKELILLSDDWDGEGAKHFSKETLSHMETFCIELYNRVLKEEIDIDPPFITPMNDGSIDVLWQEKGEKAYTLLINIPNIISAPISLAIVRRDNI